MPEEVRPWWGRALTVFIAVICAGMTLSVAVAGEWGDAALIAPWTALLALACWATFWRPRVVVSDGGIRIVNVSRTIDVPWPALEAIETRWALTLVTTYGHFTAWSAPAPGLRDALTARSDDRTGTGPVGTPSGEAAAVVQRRWAALRAAGHLDDPQLERPRPGVRWHVDTALTALVLVAVGVLTAI